MNLRFNILHSGKCVSLVARIMTRLSASWCEGLWSRRYWAICILKIYCFWTHCTIRASHFKLDSLGTNGKQKIARYRVLCGNDACLNFPYFFACGSTRLKTKSIWFIIFSLDFHFQKLQNKTIFNLKKDNLLSNLLSLRYRNKTL